MAEEARIHGADAQASSGPDADVESKDRHDEPLRISEEEQKRLEEEPPLRPYLVQKFQKDSQRHWDMFYKRNTTNFFKDRNWLCHEFPVLLTPVSHHPEGSRPHLFEIGCGVGNTIFPVRRENPALFTHACDLSKRAIDFVKGHEEYTEEHCHAFVCNLSEDDVTQHVPEQSIDMVTAFFVLSAMSLEESQRAINNIRKVLKPGGRVLFRDYALNDHAMLRFKSGHKLTDQLYVRQDGTRAFYFTKEQVVDLFSSELGFEVEDVTYIYRETVNKKEKIQVPRSFVQGVFKLAA